MKKLKKERLRNLHKKVNGCYFKSIKKGKKMLQKDTIELYNTDKINNENTTKSFRWAIFFEAPLYIKRFYVFNVLLPLRRLIHIIDRFLSVKSYTVLLVFILVVLSSILIPISITSLKFTFPNFELGDNFKTPFELIISSLASLSGIVIALLLIAVEVQSKQVGPNFYKYLIKQIELAVLVNIFVACIVFCATSRMLAVFYYLGDSQILILSAIAWILFGVIIVIFFPLMFIFFRSSRVVSVLQQETSEIDLKFIELASRTNSYYSGSEYTEYWGYSPFKTLEYIVLNNMEQNVLISKSTITDLNLRVIELFSDVQLDENSEYTVGYSHVGNGRYSRDQISMFKPVINLTEVILQSGIALNENLYTTLIYEHRRSLEFLIARGSVANSMSDVIDSFLKLYKLAIKEADEEKLMVVQLNVNSFLKSLLEIDYNQYIQWDVKEHYPDIYPYHDNKNSYGSWIKAKRFTGLLTTDLLTYAMKIDSPNAYDSICSSIGMLLTKISSSKKINWALKGIIIWEIQLHTFNSVEYQESMKNVNQKMYFASNPLTGTWLTCLMITEVKVEKYKRVIMNAANYITQVFSSEISHPMLLSDFLNAYSRYMEKVVYNDDVMNSILFITNFLTEINPYLERSNEVFSNYRSCVFFISSSLDDTKLIYGDKVTDSILKVRKIFLPIEASVFKEKVTL